MNPLLESLINFVYPSRCRYCGENIYPSDGHYICQLCWQEVEFIEKPFCDTCGQPLDPLAALPDVIPSCDKCAERQNDRGSWYFRRARSAVVYKSVAARAFQLLKYYDKPVMAEPLANLMLRVFQKFFEATEYDYMTLVPLHKWRRWKRGYNQVELLGGRLSKTTGIPMKPDLVVKTANTPPQVGLSRRERQRNVQGHFDITDKSTVSDARILLIDDVFTTGSTVSEVSRILLRKGKAKYVDAFTLLRVVMGSDDIDIA
ncbi:hypothetical protein GF312_12250 [Candidatus Poribacteria bacterium]|nr:hypothetical protein [Candidatus Poribacteria bacterium]